jgi:pilus assembly protein CpaF
MSLFTRIEKAKMQQLNPEPSRLENLRMRRAPAYNESRDTVADLKKRIQETLLAELDPRMDLTQIDEVVQTMENMFNQILATEVRILSRSERQNLFAQIKAEILGLGPLEVLLSDDSISEIMVNGPNKVYIERDGRLTLSDVTFEDDDHVRRIIDRIVSPLGRRIDEAQPMVDARLPNGSRVNAVIPPLAIDGPTITIRKFRETPLTMNNLIQNGTITPEAAEFLRACVVARLNIVVSGGTGSGKTVLLNVCSNFIPDGERIITVEDAAELQLATEHVVRLEAKPANIEGKGEISIRDLVKNTLRMRPHRIIVGECRSHEALDMLQAMNTGHEGSMTTAHANNPRDCIARLETMTLMAGMDLPVRAIREQIASAINLIVQTQRLSDGSRRVVAITEVQGMEGDVVVLSNLYVFEQKGVENGKVIGRLKPTGMRPRFMNRIEEAGIHLPPNIFGGY